MYCNLLSDSKQSSNNALTSPIFTARAHAPFDSKTARNYYRFLDSFYMGEGQQHRFSHNELIHFALGLLCSQKTCTVPSIFVCVALQTNRRQNCGFHSPACNCPHFVCQMVPLHWTSSVAINYPRTQVTGCKRLCSCSTSSIGDRKTPLLLFH